MLIRVMYKDGRQDRVKAAQLQELIKCRQIKRFKRFSGWVSVVYDDTRERPIGDKEYDGRERRTKEEIRNVFLDEPSDI